LLKKTGILALFIIAWHCSFAYRDMPVLTHLGKAEQKDTFGFNLVIGVPQLVYNLLEKKLVPLWDSPEKNINISIEALKSIETNSKTSFVQTNDVFLYEVWSSNRKRTKFDILGFSFINKNDKGVSVSYGFIDMVDVYTYLADSIIPTNANGGANTSYLTALYSRNYYFNVVQFGTNTFKDNLLKAIQIKEKAFNHQKKIVNKTTLPAQKQIVYDIVKSNHSEYIYKSIEGFLNDNPEFFFNNGGKRMFSHLGGNFNFSISNIEVIETWEKSGALTQYNPLEVVLYFNNIALPPIPMQKFADYKLKVDFQDLKTILASKTFYYQLKRINSQEIPAAQSGKYIRALENYFWTQITEYVKYE
jgi:hypothetical protein